MFKYNIAKEERTLPRGGYVAGAVRELLRSHFLIPRDAAPHDLTLHMRAKDAFSGECTLLACVHV